MIIERIQVDGGFLDGLDLYLTQGLNVIIGGRGTGKTSIIELIRFCFGITANTNTSTKSAIEHALSTLGDGRVTVTLNDGHGQLQISRSAIDSDLENIDLPNEPIIFSQTEIESVGLSSQARIRLIDSFDEEFENELNNEAIETEISSLTLEMSSLVQEIEALHSSLKEEEQLKQELIQLEQQEKLLSNVSVDVATKQKELVKYTEITSNLQLQSNLFNRLSKILEPWSSQIESISRHEPDFDQWKENLSIKDKLQPIQKAVTRVKDLLAEAKAILIETQNAIYSETLKISASKVEPESRIRELRKEVDNLQQGAGALLNKVSLIRQQIAEIDNIKKYTTNLRVKRLKLLGMRSKLLDELETLFNNRFLKRKKIAQKLNLALAPEIKITLKQAAEYSSYINTIVSSLRGSNLKYNELAPILASSLSPRELVEAVEKNDFEFLMNVTGFTKDRAIRLISQFKLSGLEDILSVRIEDDLALELLDGNDYKEIQHLSVGQRCTVILPIILEHLNRTLIVDQPEDHLDNAFIVHTLIRSIRKKQKATQLLFSTHNANIPVLGEADNVIVMKSNGQRGYVAGTGKLDQPEIVDAITTIMEGGKVAFEKRAEFYHEHQSS